MWVIILRVSLIMFAYYYLLKASSRRNSSPDCITLYIYWFIEPSNVPHARLAQHLTLTRTAHTRCLLFPRTNEIYSGPKEGFVDKKGKWSSVWSSSIQNRTYSFTIRKYISFLVYACFNHFLLITLSLRFVALLK